MDFGIEGVSNNPKTLKDIFEKIFFEGLGHDDYPKLKKHLEKAKHVVLFTDNSGEIVFDKVLCHELKIFNSSIFITLVVKGKPIISDATLKDAQELDFKEIVDEILTTGCFAIGVDFNLLPPKLEEVLNRADLIICKGMANYEAFSETDYKPVAYLLRTKCSPIANSINIPLDVNVIKIIDS
jgi:uncharacterized protein with ATP-grasp and redox domains